jgi:hypothetical protein
MFADHLGGLAKLFVPGLAEFAFTAGDEVMEANAIAGFEIPHR